MGSARALFLIGVVELGLAVAGCKSSSSGDPVPGHDAASDQPAGSDGPGPGCPSNPDDLISDFAGDNSIAPVDGRAGGWYTYGDANGTFATANGYDIAAAVGNTNCSGPGSLHSKGMGFSDYGAAVGVDFKRRSPGVDGGMGPKMTYDASKYRGIAFWMKAATVLDGVQVSFPDLNTDGAAPPHAMMDSFDPTSMCTACTCLYLAGSWQNCSPYLVQFGKKGDGGAAVAFAKYMDTQITTEWKRFEILFADTRQDPGNIGYHTPDDKLDAAHLTAMAIQVNVNYDTMPRSARDFEIWLDDVQFIR
jgi:hypothetical protein